MTFWPWRRRQQRHDEQHNVQISMGLMFKLMTNVETGEVAMVAWSFAESTPLDPSGPEPAFATRPVAFVGRDC